MGERYRVVDIVTSLNQHREIENQKESNNRHPAPNDLDSHSCQQVSRTVGKLPQNSENPGRGTNVVFYPVANTGRDVTTPKRQLPSNHGVPIGPRSYDNWLS